MPLGVNLVDEYNNPLPLYAKKTVVIANGATGQSGEVDLEGYQFAGIVMPADWVDAAITFLTSSISGGTFQPLYDDAGLEVSIIVDDDKNTSITNAALALAPWRFVKLRSGTAANPVNQTADRTLTLILKR